MIEAYITTLKTNELFDEISNTDLENMLKCLGSEIREYNKNEYIAFAGERFGSIGIIVHGSAAVLKEDAMGNRIIMALLKPGDMFGEVAAFSNNPVWPANVHAQETCRVCFLQTVKIISSCKNMCRWHTILIQNLLKIISQKALMLNQKVEYLTIKGMRSRLCAFLFQQYKRTGELTITLSMNRNELADFLNVTRSSMSREMCKMRDEGIIDFHKSTIKIMKLDTLTENHGDGTCRSEERRVW